MTPNLRFQAIRRRDVVILFAGYPVATVLLHRLVQDPTWYGAAHIALVIATLGWAIPRVYRVGRVLGDDVDARLDERQLALRNTAYLDAFRFAAGLVLLGIIWVALGTDLGHWPVPTTYHEWNDIFWGAFILLVNLPAAILAWREPDLEPETEVAARA